MNNLSVAENRIPAMSDEAIAKVSQLEEITSKLPQTLPETSHILHAGMYARSLRIPKGVVLTGALIKVATILIVSGDVVVYIDGNPKRLTGYHPMAASAKRKQAFYALEDTDMTMIFTTKASTVKEAEEQFTDDAALLLSRHKDAVNHIVITGES